MLGVFLCLCPFVLPCFVFFPPFYILLCAALQKEFLPIIRTPQPPKLGPSNLLKDCLCLRTEIFEWAWLRKPNKTN